MAQPFASACTLDLQVVLKAQENLASLSGDSFTVTGEDGRVWFK